VPGAEAVAADVGASTFGAAFYSTFGASYLIPLMSTLAISSLLSTMMPMSWPIGTVVPASDNIFAMYPSS
jgi:hypothetical protein